jgi:hypothetical protein
MSLSNSPPPPATIQTVALCPWLLEVLLVLLEVGGEVLLLLILGPHVDQQATRTLQDATHFLTIRDKTINSCNSHNYLINKLILIGLF